MKYTYIFATAALAQENFYLVAQNPSYGPFSLNTYHTGAAQNILTGTRGPADGGAAFYLEDGKLVEVSPSDNIPEGSWQGFVPIADGDDAGLVNVGATSEDTTGWNVADGFLTYQDTQNFYFCGVTTTGSANTTAVVWSNASGAPTNGGSDIDVSSCSKIVIAAVPQASNTTSSTTTATATTTITTSASSAASTASQSCDDPTATGCPSETTSQATTLVTQTTNNNGGQSGATSTASSGNNNGQGSSGQTSAPTIPQNSGSYRAGAITGMGAILVTAILLM